MREWSAWNRSEALSRIALAIIGAASSTVRQYRSPMLMGIGSKRVVAVLLARMKTRINIAMVAGVLGGA